VRRLGSYPAVSAALLPYVISRLVVATAAVFVLVLVPAHQGGLTSVFTSWDGQWYLSVAEHGYLPGSDVVRPGAPPHADTSVDGAVAFLPLYPMVAAAVGVIVPGPLDAVAVTVALVIGGAATVAFAKLCRVLRPEDEARRAVLLFCFFPGAFILSFAYPEGLVILLACLCLLALLRHAWLVAGITAALASAARPNGLALMVACAVAAGIAIRRDDDRSSVVAPILAPLGFLAFLGYLWWRTGEAGYWFRANHVYWHDRIGWWPEFRVMVGGARSGVTETSRPLLFLGLMAGFALLIVLVLLLLRARLPAPIVAYALSYEALALLSGALAPRPRFIFTAFPLVMALGFAVKGHLFNIVLAISSAAMVTLIFFYTATYFQGRFLVAP
jgi:Mannosyltransferase (PIG-V)